MFFLIENTPSGLQCWDWILFFHEEVKANGFCQTQVSVGGRFKVIALNYAFVFEIFDFYDLVKKGELSLTRETFVQRMNLQEFVGADEVKR